LNDVKQYLNIARFKHEGNSLPNENKPGYFLDNITGQYLLNLSPTYDHL
jgi:hypothetical protein